MAGRSKDKGGEAKAKDYTRRDFLMGGGAVLAAETLAHAAPSPQTKPSYSASKGYLVYDSRKCAGCVTCMLSCSLVHEGKENLSLARIQIAQNSFARFPDDIRMAVCRQCVTPLCVQNCPTGAAFVDSANGNVRRIDSKKCIGCKTCIQSCPFQPNRTVWNPFAKKAMKCDLCLDAPYWNEKGGPFGKQACVESCPMKAIRLVAQTPDQTETDGYDVNLRNEHWRNLGLVEDMETIPPLFKNAPPPSKAKPKA